MSAACNTHQGVSSLNGAAAATNGGSKKGGDAAYYSGLIALKNNNLATAESDFTKCIQQGTKGSYCVRKSYEEYIKLGNMQSGKKEAVKRAMFYIEMGRDLESLSGGCVALCEAGAFDKVIFYTDNWVEKHHESSFDYKVYDDDLCEARLKSMRALEDERYKNELEAWFLAAPVTNQKYNFYKDIISDNPNDDAISTVIKIRVLTYLRDYWGALNVYKKNPKGLPQSPQLYSDLGKVYLYSSTQYKANAKYFFNKALPIKDGAPLDDYRFNYYIYFYAARMYTKAKDIPSAIICFKRAIQMAASLDAGSLFDNALWYYIDMSLKESTESASRVIKEYCAQWKDPTYFCDIFNLMLPTLLTSKKYDAIYDLYKSTQGFAADETSARYAYVFGRLLYLGIAPIPESTLSNSDIDATTKNKNDSKDALTPPARRKKGKRTVQKERDTDRLTLAIQLLERALISGSDYYYRAMALYRLNQIFDARHTDELLKGLPILKDLHNIKSRTKDILCQTNVIGGDHIDKNAGKYLTGYARAGLYEYIYDEYLNLYNKGVIIDTDDGLEIADALREVALTNYEYYPQSLRIAAKVTKDTTRELTKKDFYSTFPKDYKNTVLDYCSQYKIPESHMFALMRSESFFDHDIQSVAGAKGLCQLMDKTAGEIARKLKIRDYDILNPDINIHFGCFYVAELNRRLNNLWLSTFFSYNAGIGRVRKWQRDVKRYFPKLQTFEEDIMLETLPIEETREYGRKLVGATTMYGYIYENKSIDAIMTGLGL